MDKLCTYELEAVAGCIPSLELVAEDLADDNAYMGRCLHCRREITAQRGVEWRQTVPRTCPSCGWEGTPAAWGNCPPANHQLTKGKRRPSYEYDRIRE